MIPLYFATYEPKDGALEAGGQAGGEEAQNMDQAIKALQGVPGSEKAIELLKAQAKQSQAKYGVSEYGQPFEFYDPMLQVG